MSKCYCTATDTGHILPLKFFFFKCPGLTVIRERYNWFHMPLPLLEILDPISSNKYTVITITGYIYNYIKVPSTEVWIAWVNCYGTFIG